MGSFITLTDRSDFLRVQHRGSKAVSKAFVLQGIGRADGHASLSDWRIGFTASKKVGNAVHRNRAKRRLRSVVGQTMPSLARSDVDYVLIARMPLTTNMRVNKRIQQCRWQQWHVTKPNHRISYIIFESFYTNSH